MSKQRIHDLFANIILDGKELEVEVQFNYYGGCRGSRDRYGVPLEPDYPPKVEILRVINLENKEDILGEIVNDAVLESLIERCYQTMDDRKNYD